MPWNAARLIWELWSYSRGSVIWKRCQSTCYDAIHHVLTFTWQPMLIFAPITYPSNVHGVYIWGCRVCDGCKSQPFRWLCLQAVITTGVFVRNCYTYIPPSIHNLHFLRHFGTWSHTSLTRATTSRQRRGRVSTHDENRVSHSTGGLYRELLHKWLHQAEVQWQL